MQLLWSPCNTLLAVGSARELEVLNPDLELVFRWSCPGAEGLWDVHSLPAYQGDLAGAWMPEGLLVASRYPGAALYEVDTWNLPHPCSDLCIVEATKGVLAEVHDGFSLTCLAYSTFGGVAILTHSSRGEVRCRMHVVVPTMQPSSLEVQDAEANVLVWSPAATHLLAVGKSSVLLSTSTGSLVLQLDNMFGATAIFSGDGRHTAAVVRSSSDGAALKMFKVADGSVVFSLDLQGPVWSCSLRYLGDGDKLFVSSDKSVSMITFGLPSDAGTEFKMCCAIANACSLAAHLTEPDDSSDDQCYGHEDYSSDRFYNSDDEDDDDLAWRSCLD